MHSAIYPSCPTKVAGPGTFSHTSLQTSRNTPPARRHCLTPTSQHANPAAPQHTERLSIPSSIQEKVTSQKYIHHLRSLPCMPPRARDHGADGGKTRSSWRSPAVCYSLTGQGRQSPLTCASSSCLQPAWLLWLSPGPQQEARFQEQRPPHSAPQHA